MTAREQIEIDKAQLREQMRKVLRGMGETAHAEGSALAARRVDGLEEVSTAVNLLLFCSLVTEVGTEAIFEAALARGQSVFFPIIEGQALVFRRVVRETAWRRGPLGALEPESGSPITDRDLERGATVVFVPGLAFSEQGDRLGRGGGHYDRALGRGPIAGRVFSIGLAFNLQVLPSIPRAAHDRRVDLVVTESRTIRPGAAG